MATPCFPSPGFFSETNTFTSLHWPLGPGPFCLLVPSVHGSAWEKTLAPDFLLILPPPRPLQTPAAELEPIHGAQVRPPLTSKQNQVISFHVSPGPQGPWAPRMMSLLVFHPRVQPSLLCFLWRLLLLPELRHLCLWGLFPAFLTCSACFLQVGALPPSQPHLFRPLPTELRPPHLLL